VELMAGAYTDNQPDFSWLQPYETKTFRQYWYPIQQIGPAKNANTEAAVNLELNSGRAQVGVSVTSRRWVRVVLACNGSLILDEEGSVAPGKPFTRIVEADDARPEKFKLIVRDANGNELITYQPERHIDRELPKPAAEPPEPAQIASVEELYLTGLHLEQYRHATRSPEAYWAEGLDRDPGDARLNNAMGLLHLRKGEFSEAEDHFARSIRRLTFRNPNPYDGEPFYNLGLAQLYQGKTSEAYDAFYKSIWNYAWQSAGNYALACISAGRGDPATALEQVEKSLLTNHDNLKARALKASLLRRMGQAVESRAVIADSLALDRLDFRMMAERFLLSGSDQELAAFLTALQGDLQTLLDVGFDLAWSGSQEDAFLLLEECRQAGECSHPMLWYTLSWLAAALHKDTRAAEYLVKAEASSPRYCFPARIEELVVLKSAIARNPSAARAHYYLGNLYYDKRRYDEAIRSWRRSVELDATFSIPWRNLGIAEFNVLHNPQAAERMYERAFAVNPEDARILYEWDQLKKRAGLASAKERLHLLDRHKELVSRRDDLTVEYITLLNQCGQWKEALEMLGTRRFSPWEGGEGLVSEQYVQAHRALGRSALVDGRPADALEHFDAARKYPQNLGEGKHLLTQERDLDYLSGLAAQQLGDLRQAQLYWKAAAEPLPGLSVQSYFQALSLLALGDRQPGLEVLSRLAEFAATQMEVEPKIDYFATSLPNLLLFNDDLGKRHRVESLLLSSLSSHGLGDVEAAIRQLEKIVAMDPNHPFVGEMLGWIKLEANPIRERFEVRAGS
jgi:tetratricopeptide (TPR) repeat protein